MKKNLTPLQIENREKWIQALRSGNYLQGRGVLRSSDDKYCCLGVCADILNPGTWTWTNLSPDSPSSPYTLETFQNHVLQSSGDREIHPGKYISYLKENILEMVGLNLSEQYILATLNDEGTTFHQIADLLESQEEITSVQQCQWGDSK